MICPILQRTPKASVQVNRNISKNGEEGVMRGAGLCSLRQGRGQVTPVPPDVVCALGSHLVHKDSKAQAPNDSSWDRGTN